MPNCPNFIKLYSKLVKNTAIIHGYQLAMPGKFEPDILVVGEQLSSGPRSSRPVHN